MNILKKIYTKLLYKNFKYKNLYLKLCKPSPMEYAEYLKLNNYFYAVGDYCSVLPSANITDPKYVRLGNNVRLSECTILGHDGSVNMLNRAFNKKLDRVGKTDLKDNVFIGHGAIIMPNVTIGPNAIVGAGSVVTKNVKEGSVVAGNPAKEICRIDKLVEKLEIYTDSVPWRDLIKNREGGFDPKVEGALVEARVKNFFK